MEIKFKNQDNTPFWGCTKYPTCKKTLNIDYNQMDDMTYHLQIAQAIMQGYTYPPEDVDSAYQAIRLASHPPMRPAPSSAGSSSGATSKASAPPPPRRGWRPPQPSVAEEIPVTPQEFEMDTEDEEFYQEEQYEQYEESEYPQSATWPETEQSWTYEDQYQDNDL